MTVDPYHGYSNESERANLDIYDGFKLKKLFSIHCLYSDIYDDFKLKKNVGLHGLGLCKNISTL